MPSQMKFLDVYENFLVVVVVTNAIAALAYCAVTWRTKLISGKAVASLAVLAIFSTVIYALLQTSESDYTLNITDSIPFALLPLPILFTDITWKPQIFSVAILGSSQVLLTKGSRWAFFERTKTNENDHPDEDQTDEDNKDDVEIISTPIPSLNEEVSDKDKVDPILEKNLIFRTKTMGKTSISVEFTDILTLNVDALIVPVTPQFSYIDGVSDNIRDAAGPELHKERNLIPLYNNIRIDPGDTYVTSSYDIQKTNKSIKYLVHVAEPSEKDAEVLERFYSKLLRTLEKKKIRKISFLPLTGSTKKSLPEDEATSIAFTRVYHYIESNPDVFDKIVFSFPKISSTARHNAERAWCLSFLEDVDDD
eukprot:GHVR01120402.1.p1 GENE.GHVR01120402.1~~GHVR01120402.1.p1  ORF type:complete len:365 (+),score=34.25 GHVR01120402.1:178-1272(+)